MQNSLGREQRDGRKKNQTSFFFFHECKHVMKETLYITGSCFNNKELNLIIMAIIQYQH